MRRHPRLTEASEAEGNAREGTLELLLYDGRRPRTVGGGPCLSVGACEGIGKNSQLWVVWPATLQNATWLLFARGKEVVVEGCCAKLLQTLTVHVTVSTWSLELVWLLMPRAITRALQVFSSTQMRVSVDEVKSSFRRQVEEGVQYVVQHFQQADELCATATNSDLNKQEGKT